MNKIQCKNRRIRTYAVNNISLSCFDKKNHIHDNGIDALALGY